MPKIQDTFSIQADPKAYSFKAYPKVKNPKVGLFLRAPEDFEGLRSSNTVSDGGKITKR